MQEGYIILCVIVLAYLFAFLFCRLVRPLPNPPVVDTPPWKVGDTVANPTERFRLLLPGPPQTIVYVNNGKVVWVGEPKEFWALVDTLFP